MKADPLPDDLAINPALVEEILVRFIRNEITRTGFRRAVLGLSGGIDSSVVAYLAARALGPKNVLAVTMPYKTSSAETRDDSAAVVAALGVATLDVPITAASRRLFRRVSEASRMRLANKCARERMTILYDQSAAFEGLVARHQQQDRAAVGLRHAVWRPGLGHQPDRRPVQDPAAATGGPPRRAQADSRQAAQRRPVGGPDRRRGAGLHLRRGRPAAGAAGRSPLAADAARATPASTPTSSTACCR